MEAKAASPDDIDVEIPSPSHIDSPSTSGVAVPVVTGSNTTSAASSPQINERAIDVPNVENGR